MGPTRLLRFKLSERIGEAEVSPSGIPLPLLKQYVAEVSSFLSGSRKVLDLANLPVALKQGSLEIEASGLPDDIDLWTDLESLREQDSLQSIDRVRAAVIEKWQEAARKRSARAYSIEPDRGGARIRVSAETAYRHGVDSPWYVAERYLRGSLYESGGKTSPNIHLQLESGQSLPIAATREQLRDDTENRLYHQVMVRVAVEQHRDTGELRNARLIRFEDYRPAFDPHAFEAFVEEGSHAWRDIDDPAAWVRNQRGG
jgi:hypothetical protein